MSYVFLASAIFATVLGQIFYRLYFLNKKIIFLILTVLFFVSVPVCNYMALRDLPMDIVYMAAAAAIAGVILAGAFFLNEKINSKQLFGAFLVIVGILIYNY